MDGLMMDYPLVLTTFLERARRLYPAREIVTRMPQHPGGVHRYTYSKLDDRAKRLASALASLGVVNGDRVGTFGWNTYRHLEAYFGVPGMGAVCHTLNIRLFPDQLVYIANHAQDKVVLIDEDLIPAWLQVAPKVGCVATYVVMGSLEESRVESRQALQEASGARVLDYEDLLDHSEPIAAWPELDEKTASFMCYTSGTTGDPKGVVYTHRALYLHSMVQVMVDTLLLSETDAVLPVVPMFHANAWGLPFSCAMVGAKQVMPGPAPTPADVARLIEAERVTMAAAVPTVWLGALDAAEKESIDLTSLTRILCGGSPVPRSLIKAFDDKHGVIVQQGWGMTETGPLAIMAHIKSQILERLDPDALLDLRAKQGILVPGLEIKLEGEDGSDVAWDGRSMGELCIKGPWIASAYYKDDRSAATFRDGWMHTGDVATIDSEGYVTIVDRTKDLVKSGGEWISSVDLESTIMGHPKVLEAAVIGVPDEKWQERPAAFVVARAGETVTQDEVIAFLTERVAKWWLPDRVIVTDEIPKTSVGKFDKKVLRTRYAQMQESAGA
jgi:fatty-acyl-CoA synthase